MKLCLVDPATRDDAALARARAMLSDDERAYADRCRHPRRRREFLIGRALLRERLAALLGGAPEAIGLRAAEHGRLELARATRAAPSFNVSHTQGLVVVALSPPGTSVGVDVEYRPRDLELPRLARRHFSPREQARWSRLEGEAARAAFFELWTLKEAYLKALGTGLSRPSHTFSFEIAHGEIRSFTPEPGAAAGSEAWRFVLARPTPSHQLALALRAGPEVLPDETIDLQQTWLI